MNLNPASIAELSHALACSSARSEKVGSIELGKLNRVLEHKAEDMTATVEAGITLGALQKALAQHGQWLPLDPPNSETITIHDLLAHNASGPRRFGYGTIGDYVIGLKTVLADGRVIQSGGKVVKNVAGYDLAKLFIGARSTLGVVAEVTFKLRPLPQTERFVQKKCGSLKDADQLIASLLDSDLTPVVLDLHNSPELTLVAAFAGTNEEVEWQLKKAAEFGLSEPSSVDYENTFWAGVKKVQNTSVLPSKLIEMLAKVEGPFVARAANGLVYHCGSAIDTCEKLPHKLMQRLKDEFDPKHLVAEL